MPHWLLAGLVEFGAVVVLTLVPCKCNLGRRQLVQKEGEDGLQVDACACDKRERKERAESLKKRELRASRKWQMHCLSLGESAIKAVRTFSSTAATTYCEGWCLSLAAC